MFDKITQKDNKRFFKTKKAFYFARLGIIGILLAFYTATGLIYGIHNAPELVNVPVHYVDYIAAMLTTLGVGIIAIKLPGFYYYQFVGFCFISQYLGMMLNFYDKFLWWDIFLHFTSGIILCTLAYYIYTIFCKKTNTSPKKLIGLWFALFTGIACAAIWEIYEFTIDVCFGFDAQGITVNDTMEDIIAGTIGSLISVIIIFFIKKYNEKNKKQ
ncbi:MAG: hypothetical protein RR640_03945 [Oscillospiraceae bacterium]